MAEMATVPTRAPSTPHANNSRLPAQPRSLSCFPSAGLRRVGLHRLVEIPPPSQWHREVRGQEMPWGHGHPGGVSLFVDASKKKRGTLGSLPSAPALGMLDVIIRRREERWGGSVPTEQLGDIKCIKIHVSLKKIRMPCAA